MISRAMISSYLSNFVYLTPVNYSEARENFKQVLDRVSHDCDSTLIKRRDYEDIVLLSKSFSLVANLLTQVASY